MSVLFARFPDFALCPSKTNTYMKMCMEYWWKDTDWLKQKYSQKKLSQYHFEG
jgi:hypothetical protein